MTNPVPLARTRDVFAIAAAVAIIAGAVEAGVFAFQKLVLGQIAFVSHDFVWMTPVAYLLLVVPAALMLHGAAQAARRPLGWPMLLGLLTVPLVFSLLLPHTVIAWWASALLATGTGVQVSRLAATSTPERWMPRLRAVAVGLAAVMATTGVAVRAAMAWTEQRAAAAVPTPATPRAPNVLLIVLDTVRSSNLSVYGYERPTTPELARWAADATVFARAIATAPWTLPSHGSMLTGREAGSLEGSWKRPISQSPRTLAESLGSRGYATAGFVANLRYTSRESGLARGFVHYDDYRVSWPLLMLHAAPTRMEFRSTLRHARSAGAAWDAALQSRIAPADLPARAYIPADQVAGAFLDWQRSVASRPFFAFLNMIDAHEPYHSPASFRQRFAGTGSAPIDLYDAAIAWQDHVIGDLLDTLRARGVLDQTIVIVTSDHGEQFGEHGLTDHANSLYLPLLHVPLFIRYPADVPAGRRVDALVSLRNLPATILELAGAPDRDIPGSSLSQAWRTALAVHGDVTAELEQGINVGAALPNARGGMVSRFDERLHYIRNGDGREELYDYRADPQELRNLAGEPAMRAHLLRLSARPAPSSGSPRPSASGRPAA